jgi:hypothetical protein
MAIVPWNEVGDFVEASCLATAEDNLSMVKGRSDKWPTVNLYEIARLRH